MPDLQPQRPPCFLVGPERAGTTMIRLMLQRHPSIAWNSESEYFVDWVTDDGRWPDLNEYRALLRHDYQYNNDRVFAGHRFSVDETLDYPSLVRSFLEQARRRQGDKPVLGATVHRHFDRLLHIWPDARFIKITRDGRDVANSLVAMGWCGNVWTACARWLEAERRWDALRARLTDDERFIEVRYEELVEHPEPVLTKVCEFLGVSYDASMLTYDRSSGYEYPNPRFANQWKHKMAPRDVRLAEAKMGEVLVRRGYPLSGLPPMRVGRLRRAWLKLENRLGRTRSRVRQFGVFLVAGAFLGRRLRLRPIERHVWGRMNRIVTAGLKK